MNFIGKKRSSCNAGKGKTAILCLCALASVMGSLCFADWGFAQEVQTIDFETIPGGSPSDNVVIGTQFAASHGMTFKLDTDGDGFPNEVYPRLEQVGNEDNGWVFMDNVAAIADRAAKGHEDELGQFFLAYDND